MKYDTTFSFVYRNEVDKLVFDMDTSCIFSIG